MLALALAFLNLIQCTFPAAVCAPSGMNPAMPLPHQQRNPSIQQAHFDPQFIAPQGSPPADLNIADSALGESIYGQTTDERMTEGFDVEMDLEMENLERELEEAQDARAVAEQVGMKAATQPTSAICPGSDCVCVSR